MRNFGASETEIMLVRERRERRLADEQAEAARRRANVSEALYRDIVESSSDFVLRLSADRRIVFANSKLLAFCGRNLPSMVGRAVADALPAADGAQWSADETQDVSFEQQIQGAGGASAWVWWRVGWLGAQGGPAEYQAVGRDITLLRQLRADVESAHAEARSALVMRERLTIAHDLHDIIVHALVAVVAQLRLVRKMIERAPDQVDAELARAEAAARFGLERGREALGQVRFQRAGVDGLTAALTRAARRFEERAGVPVALDLDGSISFVSGERAEIIYRIVEEALRNVEAHAQARTVAIGARAIADEVEIEIVDDGIGFDPDEDHAGHYGLVGMDEQARMIGGRLIIRSRRGGGVRTTIRAPIRAEE
jgi:PAS domain S-box-containing protein